jgi:hypothetical protein
MKNNPIENIPIVPPPKENPGEKNNPFENITSVPSSKENPGGKEVTNIPIVSSSKEKPGGQEVTTIGDLARAFFSDFFRLYAKEIRMGKNLAKALNSAIETALNQAQHIRGIERKIFAEYLKRELETTQLLTEETKEEAKKFLESIMLEKAA